MTDKIFWQDPYRTSLETHVTGVDGNHITVAETIFFALSGGQESDQGILGGHTRSGRRARKPGRSSTRWMRATA